MSIQQPLRLAIIIGSTRIGRRAPSVAAWFAAEAASRTDMTVDVIDLAVLDLPLNLGGVPTPHAVELSRRLLEAGAFVIVTSEYNHSFPAALKHAIDSNFNQWKAKPIGFVSYGGKSGGLHAVEQLRQVFAELHAVTVRDCVSLHEVWAHIDGSGVLTNTERPVKTAGIMLDQIAWWGRILHRARAETPYPF
jgi:NAD(P)H-dependent FMN reductase